MTGARAGKEEQRAGETSWSNRPDFLGDVQECKIGEPSELAGLRNRGAISWGMHLIGNPEQLHRENQNRVLRIGILTEEAA